MRMPRQVSGRQLADSLAVLGWDDENVLLNRAVVDRPPLGFCCASMDSEEPGSPGFAAPAVFSWARHWMPGWMRDEYNLQSRSPAIFWTLLI